MADETKGIASLREFPASILTPGSFVIERYVYTRSNGKTGVQWIVHRFVKDGVAEHLIACDTRREAARYIEAFRG